MIAYILGESGNSLVQMHQKRQDRLDNDKEPSNDTYGLQHWQSKRDHLICCLVDRKKQTDPATRDIYGQMKF